LSDAARVQKGREKKLFVVNPTDLSLKGREKIFKTQKRLQVV